jgi:cytoskeletal protein CcmA (bactofilin family)
MWNDAARAKPVDVPETLSPQQERRLSAWIGKALKIEGRIVSEESLTINGQVTGTIEVGDHDLRIGDGATVTADLAAKQIQVGGTVTGSLRAQELVELQPSATVEGDIIAPRLRMAEGAVVRGKVDVVGAAKPR